MFLRKSSFRDLILNSRNYYSFKDRKPLHWHVYNKTFSFTPVTRHLSAIFHCILQKMQNKNIRCRTDGQYLWYLVRTVFVCFLLIQIPIFLLRNQGTTIEKPHLVDEISSRVLHHKERGIPEHSFGNRKIRHFKDDSANYGKLHYQEKGKDIEVNAFSAKAIEATLPAPGRRSNSRWASMDKDLDDTIPLCPEQPPDLVGRLPFTFNATPPTLEQVAVNNPMLQKGGFYKPLNCQARSRMAIIIPHRARELHLRALLWHLHPIFQRQQLYYKIYVIHQAGNLAFNKAKLMNIGYLEAMKDDDYDCVVFHDVDLLPEDDKLLYTCNNTPKHLSVAIDKYGYRLPYTSLFGGVTMLTKEQFRDVNGYSNMYWGWGGEDDDMFNRIFSRGYSIKRPPFHLARYKMTFHHRDKGNRLNLMRFEILSSSINRMQEDGLNNVKYSINSVEAIPIYTNITADVGTAVVQCKPYLSDWTCNFVLWMCEYLTLSCGMLQFNSTDDGTLAMPLRTDLVR